jgi:hypothetical protein
MDWRLDCRSGASFPWSQGARTDAPWHLVKWPRPCSAVEGWTILFSDPPRTRPAGRVARSRQGDRAFARVSPKSARVLPAADPCRSARNPHHKFVLSIGDGDSGDVSELTPVGQVLRSRQ